MAGSNILEGSYKNLLQGVSQQVAQERLDGQVSSQLNMVSDIVNGLQRRPGTRVIKANALDGDAYTPDSIFTVYHAAGDEGRHAIVNTSLGKLDIFDADFNLLGSLTSEYLEATTAKSIQSAALRGRAYIVNTEVIPTATISNTNKQNPNITGFFFVKSGAYSKTYSVNISTSGGTYTASYTTPDGSTSGDAAKATPDYIATQLMTAINDHTPSPFVTCYRTAGYVFLVCSGSYTDLSVTSNSGSSYLGASNQSAVSTVTELPAILPAAGYNSMCAVGNTERTYVWYKYDGTKSVWLETGAWDSTSSISNLFISFSLYDAIDLKLETGEGRLAGGDSNNEDPAFLEVGISGISTYQGRLVLLCGAEVVMSASGQPLRYYRSTVTELLDEDPIGIMAGSASAADFMHAIQFNRDLLLFSSTCQAVIPGTSTPISPNNAQIVLTSSYTGDNNTAPIDTGRSILFPVPISENYSGFFEMVPSNYTSSQYTSSDITQHIPKYMPGRFVTSASATNASLAVCKLSGDIKSLFIYQYKWDAESKLQGAWHQWTFPFDVCSVWFCADKILVAFDCNSKLCITAIELQAGDTVAGLTRPLTDLYTTVTVTAGSFTIPELMRGVVSSVEDVLLTYTTGTLAGDAAGISTLNLDTWVATVARNIPDGVYFIGTPFISSIIPTPPVLKDKVGNVFGMEAKLVRYIVHTSNTGLFNVQVYAGNTKIMDYDTSAILAASLNLLIEHPIVETLADVIIPVHTTARDSNLILTCSGEHQMRILGIDYVLNYHPRRRRI